MTLAIIPNQPRLLVLGKNNARILERVDTCRIFVSCVVMS